MFSSKTNLEACAALSIIEWNTGAAGTNNVFKKIGIPVIENVVNSCGNSVKGKALILHPTNLEHLVLKSSLILIMKLRLRKKAGNLHLLMNQQSNY